MADPVAEAAARLAATLEIDGLHLDGSLDGGLIRLHGHAPDSEEVRERLEEIALDIFFFLPEEVTGPGARYEFELAVGEHQVRLATAVEALPSTGEVTREEFEAFLAQLTYTEDGRPREYPPLEEYWEG